MKDVNPGHLKSKTTLVTVLAFGLASLAITPACHAQENRARLFRIKLTAMFPTDGTVKDVAGSTILGGGFSFDVPNKATEAGLPAPLVITAYSEGTYVSKTKDNIELDASYWAVGGAVRFYPGAKKVIEAIQSGSTPPPQKNAQFYLGGGIGAYYLESRAFDNRLGVYRYNDSWSLKFGGKLLAGIDIGQLLFIEGDYTMPGDSHLNTWNASVGLRF